MAKVDKIRGSINVPLTPQGAKQADDIGRKFAKAGSLHEIVSSDLDRAQHTAQGIQAHNPGAKSFKTPALRPWPLGLYEGQPTKDVLPKIHSLVKKPDIAAPGRSAQSTEGGSSFNQYKGRFLTHLRAEIADSAKNPGKKKAIVTHYRGVKLAQAWAKKGAKANLDVDQATMTSHDPGDAPGSIHHLDPLIFAGVNPGTPTVSPADDLSRPGIYLVRHGATDFNSGS